MLRENISKQFDIIRATIKTIDSSKTRFDLRKNQSLLKMWNNVFKYLESQARTSWDKSICLMYYSMLSERQARMLSWNEFKTLAEMVMCGEVLL